MKPILKLLTVLFSLMLIYGCQIDSDSPITENTIPFKTLELKNLDAFQPVTENWQIVGDVSVDRSKNGTFFSDPGKGVLLNVPEKGKNKNLFTSFEHADIDMEIDVMMPVHSNSGLYFMGRYEIQLFDSWGVKEPMHSDIGGIYQRWDNSRKEKGFEGMAPKMNAAKAPGLWQHFSIKFKAPKFDASGNKTQNAMFTEVSLNGVLIHENKEVTGPTRAAAFNDEKPLGPLMIQGDHGPVAFRNIKYKMYDGSEVLLKNIKLTEYKSHENTKRTIPSTDSLNIEREITTDSISASMGTGQNPSKLMVFEGVLNIPKPGDYIFEMKVDGGGTLFLLKGDTVLNLDGDYYLNTPVFTKISFEKGDVPFTFFYNKHRPFRQGFGLFVEGPGIAKQPLHASSSLNTSRGNSNVLPINAISKVTLQRGFIMHKDTKKTHGINVGTPKGIHYSFDLSYGSLLQVWGGDFLDVSKMWVGRGGEQLSEPLGLPEIMHGQPEFAVLASDQAVWPDSITTDYKQVGYELDKNGYPTFKNKIGNSEISNSFIPNDSSRILQRVVEVNAHEEMYYKIAEGSKIELLKDGSYGVDDKNYFVEWNSTQPLKPFIRNSGEQQELLIKIPTGENRITYNLIW